MRNLYKALLTIVLLQLSLYGQNINNTLGSGGTFTIKDGSTTFFSLSQSTGGITLTNSLYLPNTTGSTIGVIFKGGVRFIHDYPGTGTNIFVGTNSGNFTMSTGLGNSVENTAVGTSTLQALTTGSYNNAFGNGALAANQTGTDNSAFGNAALYTNTAGTDNSAFGYSALDDNTASDNSAFGSVALYHNSTGGNNNAFGNNALWTNTSGNNNSAFGTYALNQSTADSNSALGYNAGYSLTTGHNDTFIGFDAEPSTSSASDQITLGNSKITSLRCAVTAISSISDARDKRNIKDLPLGIDFLMTLKPRLYNWDRRDWYANRKPDGSKMQKAPTAGFVAQELDAAQTKANAEWLNLVLKSNPNRLEATPGNLLPIMVKAIQDLKAENDALKGELAELRSAIAEVKKEVASSLKTSQHEDAKTKLSLNQTKD